MCLAEMRWGGHQDGCQRGAQIRRPTNTGVGGLVCARFLSAKGLSWHGARGQRMGRVDGLFWPGKLGRGWSWALSGPLRGMRLKGRKGTPCPPHPRDSSFFWHLWAFDSLRFSILCLRDIY